MKTFLMEAADGTLVSVPEDKLSEWEKQQDELKAESKKQDLQKEKQKSYTKDTQKSKLEPWQREMMEQLYEKKVQWRKEIRKYL